MRIIDALLTDDRTERLVSLARKRGFKVLDTSKVRLVRIVCEDGDPDELLGELREDLRASCEDDEHYTVFEPKAIEPITKDGDDEEGEQEEQYAGTDEIEQFVEEGARLTRSFVMLSVLSGVLAAAGLLLDSTAVVVGSMVLAPLFRPLALAGVSVVLGNTKHAAKGLLWLSLSLALAAVAGALVALLTPNGDVSRLVELRAGITPFDLVVALAAGAAMALVLVRQDAMGMVGIVIAASLMPVAATLGIVLGDARFGLVGGVLFTLVANVSGILLSLIGTLRLLELQATGWKATEESERLSRRSLVAGSLMVVGLIGVCVWSYVQGSHASSGSDHPPPWSNLEAVRAVVPTDSGGVLLLVADRADVELARALEAWQGQAPFLVEIAEADSFRSRPHGEPPG